MKKSKLMIGAIAITSLLLTSCGGNSIKKDAKRLAELQCEVQKMMESATNGDMAYTEDAADFATEFEDLKEKLQDKYTSDSDKAELTRAFMKEMGNCD